MKVKKTEMSCIKSDKNSKTSSTGDKSTTYDESFGIPYNPSKEEISDLWENPEGWLEFNPDTKTWEPLKSRESFE